ncbi:UDP-glucuronic acid decarboxylase family protein [Eilatimonas milleporae]|uniref:UDP-glucuronate decarboxylase n=1 Tax=Eilatimonas milleporae TaxID=911205 RepID=A0A3M0CSY4_9PROT|nr:UDP-glucuronic acid decarboxylase family protein [Eilatimonas milleporae]RMB12641.1 UDP-glucuronate decarboxylase [Eilatimonas milleporae]
MIQVLVTGGAGFLGSHLCDRLIERKNCQVICVDNLFTGQKENIYHLLNNKDFEFIRHDITFPIYLEVDKIFNMACPASPVHYQHDPVQTLKTCVHGSINVLGLSKRVHGRIFQASTSEVYGDPTVHPQTEDYWGNVNPIGHRSCYDEGKRSAETLFMDYHRQYDLEVAIGRIFNTYGPRMHPNDGRVVSNFIVQTLKRDPITIYGEGKQTRSFCYVDDLIEAILRMMDHRDKLTGPINIGNDDEFTILELAELISDIMGVKPNFEFRPMPSDDPVQRRPDLTKARNMLNWEPKVALRDGLKETIHYFEWMKSNDMLETVYRSR